MKTSNRLICGDLFNVWTKIGKFDCLIADPPDNIGLKYKSYSDKLSEDDYLKFFRKSLMIFRCLSPVIWVSFNAKWIFPVCKLVEDSLKNHPNKWEYKLFINTYAFGQHNKRDCGNGYRPLLRLRRAGTPLYPDAIKVQSKRQIIGDKRAAPGGKVPLDVWDFERITGNCKERRSYHPTQLREGMIKRIIDFSTLPGQSVCDVFSGTGTVLRACNDRNITSIELDKYYCKQIAKEHKLKIEEFK